jgi:pyruvate,orthophosphate dikinase
MVFGNMGLNSATGVAFSRDPSTGENYFYGEYLINAQGEDVVAGIRTPAPINRAKPLPPEVSSTLEDDMPSIYKELDAIRLKLEKHYRDMQDIEFTIQEGKLWMLQCRNGKRTAVAALKIAVDLVKEKLITSREAVMRLEPEQLTQVLLPAFNANDPYYLNRTVIASGLKASPGAAVGKAVFSAAEAEELAAAGEKVILVRQETSPEDIRGMFAAQGILTSRGGMTSHAAVVARGMGRPCVAGASDIKVDYDKGQFVTKSGHTVKAGEFISLDGTKGEVIQGTLETSTVGLSPEFSAFMKWVEAAKKMKVRTNADTPIDAQTARRYGAEGIGLCRTEHMFFEADRIDHVRQMILASGQEGRRKSLELLLPMQRQDFYEIFKAMDGLPVTIRTLDPPLHEFLPHADKEIGELAKRFGLKAQDVKNSIEALQEQNPMLGLRGCRLGILYPEITAMQAQAIFEAACQAAKEKIKVIPEIMIPLVGTQTEFALQKSIVDQAAARIFKETGQKVPYLVGTMIELPRAALVADRIAAAGAEFFSFGTNDLTQTTFGLSRDDSGSFLSSYLEQEIWPKDPFVTIDQEGLGQLIELGCKKGREASPKLKIGICGEHGGDPASVAFCYAQGLDYVSCSPPRVPIARLAAAQAAIKAEDERAPAKGAKAVKADPKKSPPPAKKAAAKADKKIAPKPAAKRAEKTESKREAKKTDKKAVKKADKKAAKK